MATKREDDANCWKARNRNARASAALPVATSNTQKSGIHPPAEVFPCDDLAAHDTFIARDYNRWGPTMPEERCYVDQTVYCEWTFRGLSRTDTALDSSSARNAFVTNKDYPVGQPAATTDALRDIRANMSRCNSPTSGHNRNNLNAFTFNWLRSRDPAGPRLWFTPLPSALCPPKPRPLGNSRP